MARARSRFWRSVGGEKKRLRQRKTTLTPPSPCRPTTTGTHSVTGTAAEDGNRYSAAVEAVSPLRHNRLSVRRGRYQFHRLARRPCRFSNSFRYFPPHPRSGSVAAYKWFSSSSSRAVRVHTGSSANAHYSAFVVTGERLRCRRRRRRFLTIWPSKTMENSTTGTWARKNRDPSRVMYSARNRNAMITGKSPAARVHPPLAVTRCTPTEYRPPPILVLFRSSRIFPNWFPRPCAPIRYETSSGSK